VSEQKNHYSTERRLEVSSVNLVAIALPMSQM
jgi:hypothetical protein